MTLLGMAIWRLWFKDSPTSQGNVAMKEAALEDEAQYAGAAHLLLLPPCKPESTEKRGSLSSTQSQTLMVL